MEEVPLLKELHTRYAGKAAIVGISIDESLEQTDRTIKDKRMTWPVLADGKGFDGPLPTAYHVQGTPEIYVLDRQGKIVVRLGSAKQIEDTLKQILAGG